MCFFILSPWLINIPSNTIPCSSYKVAFMVKWTKISDAVFHMYPATHLTIRHNMDGKCCTRSSYFWDTPTSSYVWDHLMIVHEITRTMLFMRWHVNIGHSCPSFAATLYSFHITIHLLFEGLQCIAIVAWRSSRKSSKNLLTSLIASKMIT